ncbi:zf-HC2 domain-containing protein [Halomonas halmophila]|uniref:Putative zinc-finger domain-containing protein n=1 Tax=Halomonas halmophila TaxID=252 RepID=A0A4Y4EVF1_9GAMM|nr:zf-HC2 domain-containing protein [Halomonas halmophila]GED21167.1 hypothetical protein HHA01_01440 [Halomonas halmophila]
MKKCHAATRLMSLKHDRPLTLGERAALRLHLAMCSACRRCDRQFELLHRAGQHFTPGDSDDSSEP